MNPPRISVLPPLPLTVYSRRPVTVLPFPLGMAGCELFPLGLHAIWSGLRALGLRSGDEVLAPAYHHGSEIEALVQAGAVCRFYEATDTLEPDADELEALRTPRTRALFLIHYLGFAQNVQRWRRWCDERRLLLVEDAAQAWLTSTHGFPAGSLGDLSIFCLYKTFGLPDGAAAISRVASGGVRDLRGLGLTRAAYAHTKWVLSRSRIVATLRPPRRSGGRGAQKENFNLGEPHRRPFRATLFLLPRIADVRAGDRRRDNYAVLLDELGTRVPLPFSRLADGSSPHAFPIETSKKDALLTRLEAAGIYPFDFWSEPHPSLRVDQFPGAARRRATTVVVPVHQELRDQDLERIIGTVKRS